ncbi:hypothetical protein MBLNU459_g6706t1 [Dothideomycetes sp. NU459]
MSRIAVASLVAPTQAPTPHLSVAVKPPMQDEWYEENGRQYHNWQRGLYMYPHDEEERHRMDLYHNLFYDKAGIALHTARIPPNGAPRILDVGCGTGFWAIDMAERYPKAEVLGLDLANIQPAQIPPNVRFQIPFNFESLWSLGQDSWDLIHLQMLCGSVSAWPALYSKIFTHLQPGHGYIEQLEIDFTPRCDDGTLPPDSMLNKWYDYLIQATSQTAKPLSYQPNTRQLLQQAGFTDITEQVIQAPYRAWSADRVQIDIGNFNQTALDLCYGLEALSLGPFSRVFNWTRPEIEAFMAETCLDRKTTNEADPTSLPAPQQDGAECQYTVLWRKVTNKKNKTWDGDGLLVVSGGYALLKDADGKGMGRTACKVPLLPGSTLSISGKEIEVDSVLSREDSRVKNPVIAAEKQDVALLNHSRTSESLPSSQRAPKQPNVGSVPKRELASNPSLARTSNAAFKNPLRGKTVANPKPDNIIPTSRHDPEAEGALVMKRPRGAPKGKHIVDVVVDPVLSKHLREHQRAGVAFLYECVMGMRPFEGEGAILADEMGLGKTLQTIALIWTLLKQNPIYEDGPVIKKALIVCPVTLINNWRMEFRKWLGNERIGVMVAENNKTRLTDFTKGKSYNVIIIGYEKLRNVQEDLQKGAGVDIVICDEGHRLKTAANKSALAIKSLNTERRIILSGTPIQNDLSEFYTMVDFVNPGLLNKYSTFKRDFENPMIKSRQPGASERDIEKGREKSEELAAITSQFILRRTADILSQYLPPKTEYVLYCRPTDSQIAVYKAIFSTGLLNTALNNAEASLQLIHILKKVCNSPSLLIKDAKPNEQDNDSILSSLLASMPRNHLKTASGSSKLQVLDSLLHILRTKTSEKVVVVSNYTATLDVIGKLLTSLDYPFLRLDGSTSTSTRQDLVNRFNRSPASTHFVFLLSAKAGGVGLNLIGASRLVLFDIDWNPATDLQAMGRIHRDGQKRPCHIYRMVTKGALEERIYQRQMTKQGLADSVVDNKSSVSSFSPDELRDLFTLDQRDGCQTHDLLGCQCGGTGSMAAGPEEEEEEEEVQENAGDLGDPDSDEAEPSDGEEPPEPPPPLLLPTFTRSSQVDMEAQERRREAQLDRARARLHKGNGKAKGKMSSLLQYRHIDTAKLRSASKAIAVADADEAVTGDDSSTRSDEQSGMELAIPDEVLRAVVEEEGARVDYVFAKTSM